MCILEIRVKLFKTEDHASVSATLRGMADIYTFLNEKEKALQIYEKVLSTEFSLDTLFFLPEYFF